MTPHERIAERIENAMRARRAHRSQDAREISVETVATARVEGSRRDLIAALSGLGRIERDLGNDSGAIAAYAEATALARVEGEPSLLAHLLRNFGATHLAAERPTVAEPYLREALEIDRADEGCDALELANAVRLVAELSERLGNRYEAARLWYEARVRYAALAIAEGVRECGARLEGLEAAGVVPLRGIYGIVDRAVSNEPLALLDSLLDAGVRVVQYRAKAGVDPRVVRAMHAVTRARGALLIVNDDLACALEADGWHAGQEDLMERDPATIRATLGSRIFGVSCGVPGEALAAERFGADYVGVGPYAATGTKADAGAAIGEAGIRAVVDATRLPVVAIGGIDAGNLAGVARSGASMAAVISAIARAADPAAAARDLIARWDALAR